MKAWLSSGGESSEEGDDKREAAWRSINSICAKKYQCRLKKIRIEHINRQALDENQRT